MTKSITAFTGTGGKDDFTEFLKALTDEGYDEGQREIALALSKLDLEDGDFSESIKLQNESIRQGLYRYLFLINDLSKKERKLEKIEGVAERICELRADNPLNQLYSPDAAEAQSALEPFNTDDDLEPIKGLVVHHRGISLAQRQMLLDQAQRIRDLEEEMQRLLEASARVETAFQESDDEEDVLAKPTVVAEAKEKQPERPKTPPVSVASSSSSSLVVPAILHDPQQPQKQPSPIKFFGSPKKPASPQKQQEQAVAILHLHETRMRAEAAEQQKKAAAAQQRQTEFERQRAIAMVQGL